MSGSELQLLLERARKVKAALPAFNIPDLDFCWLAAKLSASTGLPMILQTSARVARQYGPNQISGVIRSLNEQFRGKIYLHLDHCEDLPLIKSAIDAGYNSVMVDGSALPLDENIKLTRPIVELAKLNGCLVEAEVGVLEGIEDDIDSRNSHLATVDDAARLFAETEIDLLAPAIGNVHGHYVKENKKLDFSILAQISKKLSCFLVLHGGSGLNKQELENAINLGVVKVNISTILKDIFRKTSDEDPFRNNLLLAKKYTDIIKKYLKLLRTERINDFNINA